MITKQQSSMRDRGGVETFVKLAKLCDALECHPSDLFGTEEI